MENQHGAGLDDAPLVVVCTAAAELSLFLRHLLESEGLAVEIAVSAEDALESIVTHRADAALVDSQLEGAVALCRRLREGMGSAAIRIIVLFPADASEIYPQYLAAGMDEGLVRPVEPGFITDLIWRRTRQVADLAQGKIVFEDLEIDIRGRRVRRRGKEIRLTRVEFELLVLLAQSPMTVLSREALIAGAWPKRVFVEPRTVNVHIARLRRRLMAEGGGDLIRTVRGSGYALETQEERRED
jgi:two-component system, OmpR family, phosphate regulon response regulator PhoB